MVRHLDQSENEFILMQTVQAEKLMYDLVCSRVKTTT